MYGGDGGAGLLSLREDKALHEPVVTSVNRRHPLLAQFRPWPLAAAAGASQPADAPSAEAAAATEPGTIPAGAHPKPSAQCNTLSVRVGMRGMVAETGPSRGDGHTTQVWWSRSCTGPRPTRGRSLRPSAPTLLRCTRLRYEPNGLQNILQP